MTFREALNAREFLVTAECSPPKARGSMDSSIA